MQLKYDEYMGFYFEDENKRINTYIGVSKESIEALKLFHENVSDIIGESIISEIKFFCDNVKITFTDDYKLFIIDQINMLC